MLLTATLTDGTATVMTTGGTAGQVNNKPGVSGAAMDASLLSSADTSIAVIIADATGTFFNVASADFTTRTDYKNDNSAFKRNSVTGQLAATATGIGSGNLVVSLWLNPSRKASL